ncbi:hypothetical protein tpqmel_0450 [Candidatus Gastranaerophilus sp. (ex Termes propinquus)]|nr:hypothetical protein tpqmel_0450 [Candidatus Gastranaerophilus sp. (ex Termes propinquus)]
MIYYLSEREIRVNLKEYLKGVDAQKQIDKAAKKYKGKRVVLYGAGDFLKILDKQYDLSGLNIVGISDVKFGSGWQLHPKYKETIPPKDLKTRDFDVILITLLEDLVMLDYLENVLLKETVNKNKKVALFISPTFSYLIKLAVDKYREKYTKLKVVREGESYAK